MFLGIDLGTSAVKLLLLDASHQICGLSEAPLSVQRPHEGWSEQDPQDWWGAVETAVTQMRHENPTAWSRVQAIGLSGQMHGAVALGVSDEILRPAILWNDGRSIAQCESLESSYSQLRIITGNLAMPGFTAPKILWMREHEPSLFGQIRRLLLPKDWLGLKLTGEAVSEMSDAAGTLWLDVRRRVWSEYMLDACALTLAQMPRLIEGSEPRGNLLPSVAARWGLPLSVIVAGGAGDNAASAVGVGAIRPGEGFVSLGTSGVVFLSGDQYQAVPSLGVHAFAHALPGRWHQMSVMLSAASAFGWLTQLTGSRNEETLALQVQALGVAQKAHAPVFLPYLSGERTPHNNPMASGTFIGLRSVHGAADLAYAVMEGVAFGLMDGQSAMCPAGPGRDAPSLHLVGGGARSDVWAQMLASGLNRPLQRPAGAHAAAALGAARLAWLATGADESEVCHALPSTARFEPDSEQKALLAPRYARYRALYPALEAHF
jgi:xylulokinase